MVKCMRRERKRGTNMNLVLVKCSLEQDFMAEKRRTKSEKRKGRTRRGGSSSESSLDDETEANRLEEQALMARHQGKQMQRPLDPVPTAVSAGPVLPVHLEQQHWISNAGTSATITAMKVCMSSHGSRM